MRTIGIFGGSFNPIHNGHLGLAQAVVGRGLADEVWLMVSPHNPLKPGGTLLDEQRRLDMARLATQDVDGVVASDFEFHLDRPSYTWKTLRALRQQLPDARLALVIGADNWLAFDRWARHDEILARHDIILYPREGYPVDWDALPPRVHRVEAPLFPWSSTEVRDTLRRGGDTSRMLPAAVESYIRRHGLRFDV